MNERQPDRRIRAAERLYALLLGFYPRRFRAEYGPAMRQALREMLADPAIGPWRACGRVLADVGGSLLPEHLAQFRRGGDRMGGARYGLTLGLVLGVAVVLTNVVYPRFDYFGLDENSAMALAAAALLTSFAVAGFLASRATGRLAVGLRAGALAALIGVGLLMLTFLVVDNLFLDLVSQQPDKVWGFQHSQYASMRAYVTVGQLRGFLLLPVFALVGAACGGIGAAARKAVGVVVPGVGA
jgi:hypothetical protein